MAVILNAHGTAYTLAGLTLKCKGIVIPGWSKESFDVSNLSNTDVRTKVVETLRNMNKLTLKEVEYDPSEHGEVDGIPEANASLVITLPSSAGTLTYWVTASDVGDVELNSNSQPVCDITFEVTNLNGSNVETAPDHATS